MINATIIVRLLLESQGIDPPIRRMNTCTRIEYRLDYSIRGDTAIPSIDTPEGAFWSKRVLESSNPSLLIRPAKAQNDHRKNNCLLRAHPSYSGVFYLTLLFSIQSQLSFLFNQPHGRPQKSQWRDTANVEVSCQLIQEFFLSWLLWNRSCDFSFLC